MSDGPKPIGEAISEIGDALDRIFGKEKLTSVWDALNTEDSGLSLRGFNPNTNTNPPQTEKPARDLDYQQIIQIAQNRQYAFNVVDVVPPRLDSSDFNCNIPSNILYSKVGYSGELGQAQNVATGSTTNNLDRFITVPLPFAGTFIKIDLLPNPVNSPWIKNGTGQNTLDAFYKAPFYVPPSFPSPATATYQNSYREYVILQFDDPNAPLIIAKPGDSFKVPFTGVFVTCLNTSRRFSVTIGFNAEIITPSNSIKDIHLAAENCLDHGTLEPQSFCLTNNDQGSLAQGVTVNNGTTRTDTIFLSTMAAAGNPFYPGSPGLRGKALGWLTELVIASSSNVTTAGARIVMGVYILNGTGNVQKQLMSVPILCGATSDGQAYYHGRSCPAKPIRFELDYENGETLAVITTVAAALSPATIAWTLNGYTMGNLYRFTTTGPLNYNVPSFLDTI